MIVNFNEDYLRDLYRSGKSDKKHRFQPQIVRNLKSATIIQYTIKGRFMSR